MTNITNRISLSIPPSDVAEVQGAIRLLQAKLVPHLVSLSAQDRLELPKFGDKTLAFVTKANDYAKEHPSLCPTYLDVAEFDRDLQAFHQLDALLRPLQQLVAALEDSQRLSGSEAYSAGLVFYQSVKGAARSKVPGAGTVAEDLGSRFPGRPSGSTAAAAAAAKAAAAGPAPGPSG